MKVKGFIFLVWKKLWLYPSGVLYNGIVSLPCCGKKLLAISFLVDLAISLLLNKILHSYVLLLPSC
jgi:hypothetical protein